VVSTHLKNIRQNGNLPQKEVNIKKISETTNQTCLEMDNCYKKAFVLGCSLLLTSPQGRFFTKKTCTLGVQRPLNK